FFFQAEDGIRDDLVTGVQTCALPISPASVVEGSIQFPRERVISSLTKYGVSFDESESTEALRDKLSAFYAQRTLLKRKVSPSDVAEACFLLSSPRLAATTGQILAVDV